MRTEEEIRDLIKSCEVIIGVSKENYNKHPDFYTAIIINNNKIEMETLKWVLEEE